MNIFFIPSYTVQDPALDFFKGYLTGPEYSAMYVTNQGRGKVNVQLLLPGGPPIESDFVYSQSEELFINGNGDRLAYNYETCEANSTFTGTILYKRINCGNLGE